MKETWGFWVAFAVAVTLGLLIFWVDSRPNWDDTGITAVALFLVTAVIGFTIPRRIWMWGLAVGVWTPLWEILSSHNFGSILALAIALIGAYAGGLSRKALKQLA